MASKRTLPESDESGSDRKQMKISETQDSISDDKIIPAKDIQILNTDYSYIIGNVISEGSNCVVYDGEFGSNPVPGVKRNRAPFILGQKFAVKFKKCNSDLEYGRLNKEAEWLKKLKHENIIDIYDHISFDRERVYIFIEYSNFGSLGNYLKDSNLFVEETQCKRWFKDLISGLKFLSDNNLVHFDINSGNVLLFKDTNKNQIVAKLSDFENVEEIVYRFVVKDDIVDLAIVFQEIAMKTQFTTDDEKAKAYQLYSRMERRNDNEEDEFDKDRHEEFDEEKDEVEDEDEEYEDEEDKADEEEEDVEDENKKDEDEKDKDKVVYSDYDQIQLDQWFTTDVN